MSVSPIDNFYSSQNEPARGTLLALRQIIVTFDPRISEAWKYGMPFFCLNKKMFCYLWCDKITREPYLGLVDGRLMNHPALIAGKRARMKILPISTHNDLPLKTIQVLLRQAITLCLKR